MPHWPHGMGRRHGLAVAMRLGFEFALALGLLVGAGAMTFYWVVIRDILR